MLSENLLVIKWRLVFYIVKLDLRQVRKNGFNKRRLMCRGYEERVARACTNLSSEQYFMTTIEAEPGTLR